MLNLETIEYVYTQSSLKPEENRRLKHSNINTKVNTERTTMSANLRIWIRYQRLGIYIIMK